MQNSGERRRENVDSCRSSVIARSVSDEAIQNFSAETVWIASLRSQ
jgi:hypothetical protein